MSEAQPGELSWLIDVVERFEESTRRAEQPRIEDYLAGVAGPRRAMLLRELLRVERQLMHRHVAGPLPDEYERRFPEDLEIVRAVFAESADDLGPGDSTADWDAHAVGGPSAPAASDASKTDRLEYASRPLLAGTVPVWPGYRILEPLSSGAMGIVSKAIQLGTNRVVALKVIRPDRFVSPDALGRFRVKVETIASLDHPHIIPIYEVGEHEGQPFFSMKYVAGGALSRHIQTLIGRPGEAVFLLATVARAVDHTHRRGILHRDLKPANILIDEDMRPYVADFGLAKRIEDDHGLSGTGDIIGTPAYMSPEQAAG
jgi:serine/threonine-protein kinase